MMHLEQRIRFFAKYDFLQLLIFQSVKDETYKSWFITDEINKVLSKKCRFLISQMKTFKNVCISFYRA